VLGDVQSLNLMLFADPNTGDHVGDFEQHDGANDRKGPSDQDTHELIPYLAPVTIEPADGFARTEDRVDDSLRENTREARADGAARTVNAESVKRVVVAEDRFDLGHHPVADQASNEANRQRWHRSDEAGGWGYGDETRDRTRNRAESAGVSV